eukprot:superscaffoldBa00000069_g1102
MDNDNTMSKIRPKSSDSAESSPESINRGVDASPSCDSGVVSPSQIGYAKKEFIMIHPEEKLRHFESRGQDHEDNQEFDACIQDLVRCVALTRLVYGDGHLKLAQAHARLAKAYFQFKGWGLQALEHSLLARELLPFCSSISPCRALSVNTVVMEGNVPTKAWNNKAHAIAMSHCPEGLERAQISHSLALILSAAAEPHHNDSAGRYFEQSLNSYKISVGLLDPAFLTAQDDFCRFLLLNGQQERCVEIQRASLISKRSTFGDLSAEVADTLQLVGSVEMSEGRMKQAHRTMTKFTDQKIYENVLYLGT